MTANLEQFRNRVEALMRIWGDEFALHRDAEILGHKSKDMLQILVEHKGEMPSRPTGWRPEEVDLTALEVERAVCALVRAGGISEACCLRAYYCGRGRVRVERLATARMLLRRTISRRAFYSMVDTGFNFVARHLLESARDHMRMAA